MADIDELKKKLEDGWIKGEPYVFVSYASKDKEKVYEFVYELRKRGINVYIDIELQENISKNWLQNIKERLYDVDCVAMISFLSLNHVRPDSGSTYQYKERLKEQCHFSAPVKA